MRGGEWVHDEEMGVGTDELGEDDGKTIDSDGVIAW